LQRTDTYRARFADYLSFQVLHSSMLVVDFTAAAGVKDSRVKTVAVGFEALAETPRKVDVLIRVSVERSHRFYYKDSQVCCCVIDCI
jgi:hypothetical protein